MNNFFSKLKISYKLFISLIVTSIVLIYLAVQFSFVIKKLEHQNQILNSGIVFSDAVFEAKYFLRSDMHILLELALCDDESTFNYWWGEHNFQIQFFNDQIKKIEGNNLLNNNSQYQQYVEEIITYTKNIKSQYNDVFLTYFGDVKNRKLEEFSMLKKLQSDGSDTSNYSEFNENNIIVTNRKKIQEINSKVSDKGISMIKMLDNVKTDSQLIVKDAKQSIETKLNAVYRNVLIAILLGLILSFWFTIYMSKTVSGAVIKIRKLVDQLALGMHPKTISLRIKDEISDIATSLNRLIKGLQKTSDFAAQIGNGKLEAEFEPLSNKDVLGNALLEMRDSLLKASKEENNRKEEDKKRNWATAGLAKFGDILRTYNNSFKELSFQVMSNLVKYLDVIQGAMFILNDDNKEDIFYELTSAIAFGRDKLINKQIKVGQGLVGRAAHEKMIIHLTEIPEDYVNINSGLGDANPTAILIIPLKLNDIVYGVIELASFNDFQQHQIDFLEQLGEDIASIISSVKVNIKTAKLLEESQHQSEELSAQEEEMRQNMEELQATQEEAARRQEESESLWNALNKSNLVVEFDRNGKILNVNERNYELTGVPADKTIGKNIKDLAAEAKTNPEAFLKFWEDLLNGKAQSRVFYDNFQGRDIWVLENYTPVLNDNGEVERILSIGTDITNIKMKELELQKQVDELQSKDSDSN
ncbi:MAG: GAF domain-containing protein [Chlorobi bacterium]|nr:GAF domain-containing protein [Chlorobiota bacterium]